MIVPRFPQAVATLEQAVHYFSNRAEPMRVHGFQWKRDQTVEVLDDKDEPWAAATVYTDRVSGQDFQALYVYQPFLKQGRYQNYIDTCRRPGMLPIVTMTDCQIELYLAKIGLEEGKDYRVLRGITDTPEYRMINDYYGDRLAERSGVYLMDHIDQGLYILKEIGASEETMKAFCLHPLYQADEDLKNNFKADLSAISARVIVLAMEYRNIANAYLSSRTLRRLDDITLSPLLQVNQMLIADKIQNLKDFVRFHRGKHPRSAQLQSYFIDWLQRLKIPPKTVGRLFEELGPFENEPSGKSSVTSPSYRDKIFTRVIRAVQVNLIRDSEEGLQIYLQRRSPRLSSYPDMWVPLGGKVEEETGASVFETALKEALEEGGVDLSSRILFFMGAEMAFPDGQEGKEKRLFIYPKLIADGNGLVPRLNSPEEAYQEGWFSLELALAVHENAVKRFPDASETQIPGGIPPGTLRTIRQLMALQVQGLPTAEILHYFQRYGS